MRLTITIDCDNAAFDDDEGCCGAEVARILHRLADGFSESDAAGIADESGLKLRDSNGNTVGAVVVTP